VEQVKTKAENLVASAVPSSSTASKHVDSAAAQSSSAPVARSEPNVGHTTSSLAGLNLGAPIGAASSATYNSGESTRVRAVLCCADWRECSPYHNYNHYVHRGFQLVFHCRS
jgi:hypothetical protein